MRLSEHAKYLSPQIDLEEIFLHRMKRKIYADRTLSLEGILYEAPAHLVGRQVEICFNPKDSRTPTARTAAGRIPAMYRAWFGMSADPFSKDIPSDKLFVSRQVQELATRLDYLIQQKGSGLLTGEAGSGKTSALRSMCHTLHPGLYKILYLPNTKEILKDPSIHYESRHASYDLKKLRGKELVSLIKHSRRYLWHCSINKTKIIFGKHRQHYVDSLSA